MACRFCLSSEYSKEDPLWEPCECKGTLQYVHKQCLLRWIQVASAQHRTKCQLCLTNYIYPLLWPREQYPILYIRGEYIFTHKSYLLSAFIMFFYYLYCVDFANTHLHILAQGPEYERAVSPQRYYYNMLIGITALYVCLYIYRFITVRNKLRYVVYMFLPFSLYNPLSLIIYGALLANVVTPFVVPAGVVYVFVLSRILREHAIVIQRMNAEARNTMIM